LLDISSDFFHCKEHTYTLTNMEAYSLSTRIDDYHKHGLPWLEVCLPEGYRPTHAAALEEKFSINISDLGTINHNEQRNRQLNDGRDYRHIYPPHLSAHEPLSFLKSGLLRPILDKFTFQSSQIFHRPPHHYSTQELIHFMNQGLVVGQNEPAVDDIELLIDLLNFNLDRCEDDWRAVFVAHHSYLLTLFLSLTCDRFTQLSVQNNSRCP
jgi:hypothetical protein